MKYNINAQVKVKLTPHGIEVYKTKAYNVLNSFTIQGSIRNELETHMLSKVEPDGTHKAQLWELMQTFGEEMYMANPEKCFVDNVIEFI